jgi:hypothetical protein
MPFRPVVLEGMTVQPRAEASGQAKWITWVVRATGMTTPGAAPSPTNSVARSANKNVGTGETFGRSAA